MKEVFTYVIQKKRLSADVFQRQFYQPNFQRTLSDKTLTRFRQRCYIYEERSGVDLYHECINRLSGSIADIMKITGNVRRMDSMMIESNIRKLTRMELIYQCISRLAVAVNKKDEQLLPDDLKHYVDPADFNQVIYHQRSTDSDERMQQLIKDGETLLDLCKDAFSGITEYKLLARCFDEQTVVSNLRRNYSLDKFPRGKQRGKFFFGSKVAAVNFTKLFNYRKGKGKYAQNPVLA